MQLRLVLLAAAFAVAGCNSSSSTSAARLAESGALRMQNVKAPDVSEYGRVETIDELKKLLDRDLARDELSVADRGLEELMGVSILAEHQAHGYLLMERSMPVWRFQLKQGTQYIQRIKQRLAILKQGEQQELKGVHAALERNDLNTLRRLRADSRSLLGAEVLALSGDFVAHAQLVDGLLAFDELRSAAKPSAADARALANAMDTCAPVLERDGFVEASFVARVLAAESLDLARLDSEAIEKWLALGQSRYLASADESVQVAIAGRIRSYTEQLRAELTQRIRTEEQGLARAQIQASEMRYEKLSAEQQARVRSLEDELSRVGALKDEQALASLSTQRAGFEGTIQHQAQRIRELEALFLEIATDRERDWRSKNDALLEQTAGTVSFAADVLTIWQSVRCMNSGVAMAR
jgi:hypothetical protein